MATKPRPKPNKLDQVINKLDVVAREVKRQGQELKKHGQELKQHGQEFKQHEQKIEQQGIELTHKLEQQGIELSQKVEQQGKDFLQKLEEQGMMLMRVFRESADKSHKFWVMVDEDLKKNTTENQQFRDQMLTLMDGTAKDYALFGQEKKMLGAGLDRMQNELDAVKVSDQSQNKKISHLEVRVERLEASQSPN